MHIQTDMQTEIFTLYIDIDNTDDVNINIDDYIDIYYVNFDIDIEIIIDDVDNIYINSIDIVVIEWYLYWY